MDESPRRMHLWELPSEIMAQITELTGATGLIFLWLSGSPSMRHLLGYGGGTTHVDLVDESKGSTSRWPQMLAQMRGLKSLSINRGPVILNIPLEALQTINSMKRLERLHLFGMGCYKQLKELSNSENDKTGENFLPSLQDLVLSVFHPIKNGMAFPRNLTRLEINFLCGFESEYAWFSHVRHHLPFLTSLHLKGACMLTPLHTAYADELSKLPLKELSIRLLNSSLNGFLPRTLENLNLHILSSDINILDHLPKGLRALKVEAHGINLENLDDSTFPHLTDLHLSLSRALDSEYPAMAFPSQLQNLNLECSVVALSFVLPPYLRTLHVRHLKTSVIETQLIEEDLSLVKKLYTRRVDGKGREIRSREGLPFSLLKLNIRGSSTRHMVGNFHIDFIGDVYPQKLETIYASDESFLPRRFDWTRLPFDTLTELRLMHVSQNPANLAQFTRMVCLELHTMDNVNDSFIATLPPSITSFALNSRTATGLTALSFQYLPKTMVHLRLTHREGKIASLKDSDFSVFETLCDLQYLEISFDMSDIADESLGLLPKSLRTLKLTGNCENLSGACFRYLPRNLYALSMHQLTLVMDLEMIYLPRKLRILELPKIQNLTDSMLSWLPTCLTTLELAELNDITFSSFRNGDSLSNLLERGKIYAKQSPDPRIHDNSVNFTWNVMPSENLPQFPSSRDLIDKNRNQSRVKSQLTIASAAIAVVAIAVGVILNYH